MNEINNLVSSTFFFYVAHTAPLSFGLRGQPFPIHSAPVINILLLHFSGRLGPRECLSSSPRLTTLSSHTRSQAAGKRINLALLFK